jgi:hypothetical protein
MLNRRGRQGGKRRDVLYPDAYVWFVFVSCLDIMLTWVVLARGGREVNALADTIIRRYGLTGMVLFKLALVTLLVLICETVGRRSERAGRNLAHAAIVISALPVSLAILLLGR